MALIEFYFPIDAEHPFANVRSDAIPRVNEVINIRNVNYRVRRVAWNLDYADDLATKTLRANVELESVI